MGEVFQATDEMLGRTVAVKLLLPTLSDPLATERFQREARAAASLNDPHLVAVYDFGRHDDGFFLVMELVEGGTVSGELERAGRLSKERALEIIEQSAAGLTVAHQHNIVHRDVKPGNLLLTPAGSVKIADFGIAQVPGDGGTALTATGQIIGSSHYLSPERARGEQAGKPSDVYALGCVLYQLVTGQPPFTAEHPTGILFQHVDTAPIPPSQTHPELAGPFEAVLLRMLAKDPAERPTAAEIAAGALRVAPATAVAPVVTSPLPVVPPPVSPPAEPPPGRFSNRKLLAAAAAAVLATAGVATALILNGNETKSPTTDIGPQPGASSSAPVNPSQSGQTGTGQTEQPSTQPTKTTSEPATPTPTPSAPTTPTPSATPTPTPTPTVPSQTPTASKTPPPVSNTPEPSASKTPPPETPASTPPPTSPPPGEQPNAD